jgi:CubicO group peptidase (beta-lactamase class C family)
MRTAAIVGILVGLAATACHNPTPAYPPPLLIKADPSLEVAFADLSHKVGLIADEAQYDAESFSISVTSETETLWSHHHTARELDPDRPGANPVDGHSFYRIASITKIFCTHALLQLYSAGKLSLEDPVSKHLPGLKKGLVAEDGGLDWDHITVRALAGQIGGLPRDWNQEDFLMGAGNHLKGFPPPTNPHLPTCFGWSGNFSRPCNESELYEDLRWHHRIAGPNQIPSYSNTAFELLGLVVANVSGQSFIDYVTEHILERHFITPDATFTAPPDNTSALTKASWYFNVDLGIHIPAGGLYANTYGLDQYLRTVLANYKFETFGGPKLNMFIPQGYSFGMNSAYGLTWENFRTDKILPHNRPVTFYTKGGGHPGYSTNILAVPDLGLGITILCTGDKMGQVLRRLRELVTVEVVRAVDQHAEKQVKKQYAGDFVFDRLILEPDDKVYHGKELNSSLSLAYTAEKGFHATSCISNGTDLLASLGPAVYGESDRKLEVRFIPTGQYAVVHPVPRGQIWRGMIQQDRTETIWDDFCNADIDGPQYDGRPLLELVFYESGSIVVLTGLRTRYKRLASNDQEYQPDNIFRVQGGGAEVHSVEEDAPRFTSGNMPVGAMTDDQANGRMPQI